MPYSIKSHSSQELEFNPGVLHTIDPPAVAAAKRICLLRSVLETRQIGFFGLTSLKSIHSKLVKRR